MIRAYRLYTGDDGDSHVERGYVENDILLDVEQIQFKETAAHASLAWHNAPIDQYVITLTGVLEFRTRGGETFTLAPGEILIALDTTGSGHEWRLVNDEPWKRAYVTIRGERDLRFHAFEA
jgi:quercetin dioxygenase-like cupin family protein